MKKIAIVYTGSNQDPLVQRALAVGHKVILLASTNLESMPHLCKTYCISSMTIEEIVTICRHEKIDGICSVASEFAVIPIAEICERMRLPGISLQLAKLCTNKLSIKKKFTRLAVKTPKYDVAFFADSEGVVDKCKKIGFPVVFKPVDSCNSKGITVIGCQEQIQRGLNKVKKHTCKDRFMIEQFVFGESFGVEVWVNQHEVVFVLPVGNYSNAYEGIDIPIGHYAPYLGLTVNECEQINRDVRKIINDTGRQNGHYTIDCRRDHRGNIFYLEMGARCGGNMLPELLSQYYDLDIYYTIIGQALGENMDIRILKQQPCAAGYKVDKDNNKYDSFVVQAETGYKVYLLGKSLIMQV